MGLLVSVYRSADLGDCTNGGVSSRHVGLCLVNVSGPFEPSDRYGAAMLESHVKGCLRVVPVHMVDGQWQRLRAHWMMGGNYAATSDSRMSEACERLLGHRFYGAVPIHDRTE